MAAVPSAIPVGSRMLGMGLALVAAAYLYGQGATTIGAAFLLIYYVRLTFNPIEIITSQLEEFQRAAAGISRVRDVLATESALPDRGATPLPDGPLAVELREVSFGYGEEDMVLREVALRLAPGQVLGLLGRTGSGKTSIARLLVRLYDPAAGTVSLAGVDLREVPLAELRRRVGMVTQEVQLFGSTLRDNLTLFDRSIPDERVMAALEQLGLDDWGRGLPRGLDTVIGPGGVGLSAGEAQLVAFTRLLMRDPGLVILDEASSRLDPVTERLIERAVDQLLTGRTGIVIAHRLSTVERADRILLMEDGRVVEDGPRAALASDPGSRFARLLRAGLEAPGGVRT
jgi:ATP-binding cassette subfamily B protein